MFEDDQLKNHCKFKRLTFGQGNAILEMMSRVDSNHIAFRESAINFLLKRDIAVQKGRYIFLKGEV